MERGNLTLGLRMNRSNRVTGVIFAAVLCNGLLCFSNPAAAQNREYLQGPSHSAGGTVVTPRRPVADSAEVPSAPAAAAAQTGGAAPTFEQLGIPASAVKDGVYGATMEMTVGKTPVTLVVLGEGTTSLYLGNSGEISGGGLDSSVRTASTGFLDTARKVRLRFKPSTANTPRSSDKVLFTLMTTKGVMKSEARVATLSAGTDPLSPLYDRGQKVITELREISERADGSGATAPAAGKGYSRAMPPQTR